MNIETLINKVTTETITKLRKSKMINDNEKKAFKKTEEVLKSYNKYKIAIEKDPAGTVKTQKLVNIIESAIKSIEKDSYYEIIRLLYFEEKTREDVADYFSCDVKTITRNKKRLVNELKLIIFSDDSIAEVFFE